MTNKKIVIRFFSIMVLFILLGGWSAGAFAKNGNTRLYLPLGMNKYESWSTNFANVTDLAAAGITAYDNAAAIDTTNVNSGGKSIKAYGTIGGSGELLDLGFTPWGLIASGTIDLSEKQLSIEMYLPADSPIYEFRIFLFYAGNYVVVKDAHTGLYKGQWHTYRVDLGQDISLKTWRTWAVASPGTTDAMVVDIIKHVQNIGIYGVVFKDHLPRAETYFLVDRLGWESASPLQAWNPAVESLRQYSTVALPIGGFIEPDGATTPEYMQHFVQEFNLTQAWGKFPTTEPTGAVFPYDEAWDPRADAEYFRETRGMPLIRYTGSGGDPNWIPTWLPEKNYADTQIILEKYIHTLVDHHKGKTYIWNLFNELLRYDLPFKAFTGFGLKDRNQSPPVATSEYSPWSASPSDLSMIEDAFRVARAADPQALLIINDAGNSNQGQVGAEAMYAMVAQMKADGVPIDGVGFEGHYSMAQDEHFYEGFVDVPFDQNYGFTGIAAMVERYAAIGLKVAFTEVDVPIYIGDIDTSSQAGRDLLAHRRQLQAAAYRSLLHIARTHPNVMAFHFWDWADEFTYNEPDGFNPQLGYGYDQGLFDLSYQKKPAYSAVLEELKAPVPAPLPGPFNKTSPAEGTADQPVNPTLGWTASSGATGYQYCIDTSNNNVCNTAWVSTGASTNVSVNVLPLTNYSWQVRASNVSGVTHANLATWGSFTTQSDWSTDFANVTDPAAAGIFGSPGLVSLDTQHNSGVKSIKLSPDPGMVQSWMILNFGMPGLVNHASFNLSEKMLSFEIYLPAASPLDGLVFKIIGTNDQVLQIYIAGGGDLHKGAWYTYSIDLDSFTSGSDLEILTHARQLLIVAGSGADIPAGAYFLVDQLGWETLAP
jgi:GH35 family endo-1,4-beta-xylanase